MIGSTIAGVVVDVGKESSVLSVGDVVVPHPMDDRINENIRTKKIKRCFFIISILSS